MIAPMPRRRLAVAPKPRTLAEVPPNEPGISWATWYCRLPLERVADMAAWAELDAERERLANAAYAAAEQKQKAKRKGARAK